ncbi:hypothetical protein BGZ70_009993 [Mortierella alpina]|uniref:Uncharacterized protein n=1 Tax=Mortierella alpina TaxID=64518 RepID=A0A9P6J3D1_MORAP|nr:hypothetical protein BGZ70_009993 [Mortierella alpina]
MIITTAIALKLARGLFLEPQPSSSPATSTAAQEPPAAETPAAAPTSQEAPIPQEAPTEPNKPAEVSDSDGDQDSIPYVSASDCNACPTPCQDQDHPHYPSYLKIDQETPLLNSTRTYTRHVLISTGQEDWEASIYDDKDSLAPHLQKAIDDGQERLKQANGGKDLPRIVLTNSSRVCEHWGGPGWQVIVLPDHIVVNNVTPEQCDDFFEAFLKPSVGTTVAPGTAVGSMTTSALAVEKDLGQASRPQLGRNVCSTTTSAVTATATSNSNSTPSSSLPQDGRTSLSAAYSSSHTTFTTTTTTTTISTTDSISFQHEHDDERAHEHKDKHLQNNGSVHHMQQQQQQQEQQQNHRHHHHHAPDQTREVTAGKTTFIAHRWQPAAALMICSHKRRDKRCGVTAAILKKEFTRILRSKDIYGDGEGDVEIWLISHIGGHKFAGNVIVHKSNGLAVWYGRVEPCHADAIVETTLEKGQVIKELYRGSMMGSFDPHHKKTAW